VVFVVWTEDAGTISRVVGSEIFTDRELLNSAGFSRVFPQGTPARSRGRGSFQRVCSSMARKATDGKEDFFSK
jgi:hypothetical protein